MAPVKDKWIRRFIIPETTRHKDGFTIYKVTSLVFLNSSREEVSKVSVWKRYKEFKKLHSDLNKLYKRLEIKESFPVFLKLKYFGRFEVEVIEERKIYALKLLEFIGRYSCLYSSDTFIKFFETGYTNVSTNDYFVSSDTSEDDNIDALNISNLVNNIAPNTLQAPYISKTSSDTLTNSCSTLSVSTHTDELKFTTSQKDNGSYNINNIENTNNKKGDEQNYRFEKLYAQDIKTENNTIMLNIQSGFDTLNNETQSDVTQYILIAAGHINAAFKHEYEEAEYEKAFAQYKLAISHLISGVKYDPDSRRVTCVKDKISKYLAQAEQLYSKHLNYNIPISRYPGINKPVSELENYKILKIIKPVVLALDIRVNCRRIIKSVEKSSIHKDNINNYILRGQIPYMVHLYAYVETETTVFFILQYASGGKLWDYIKLYYKVFEYLNSNLDLNNVVYNINNPFIMKREVIHVTNEANKVVETAIVIEQDSNRFQTSENNNLEGKNDSYLNTQIEIYNVNTSTTHLLEKSQKLLQSVNATLNRSNSIASRLDEYKELKQSGNISPLNTEIISRTCKDLNVILPVTCNNKSLNSKGINVEYTVDRNRAVKALVKNTYPKDTNHFSMNDSNNLQMTQDTCAYAVHGNLITYKNKIHDVSCNNPNIRYSISSRQVTSINNNNHNDNNIVHVCKDNNTRRPFDKINSLDKRCNNNLTLNKNQSINYLQHLHSYNEINVDEEQKLWQIPEAVIRSWAAEILTSLEVLHQQNILIFDFKPDNILLDDMGHIRLTYIVPQHNMQLLKFTYPYSSPELCTFSPTILITSATDIWSFGVILYELFTGIAFTAKHPVFHSHSVINIPNRLSENAQSLLYDILKYHPNERITIDEIKRHPFFAETDWSNRINSLC